MSFRASLALALIAALAVTLVPRNGRADLQLGRFTLEFRNSNYNLKTGDIVLTGGVSGKGPDGDFRADRAFGNRERQEITLVGNVEAHRRTAAQVVSLRSDTATIDERNRTYIASGGVVAQVGTRTMSADQMRLDDATHIFTLTGSVLITEPPGRSLSTTQLTYHDDSGDIAAPDPISGTTETGDFRADRAAGNLKTSDLTLTGGVMLHSGAPANGPSRDPIALYANTVRMDGASKRVNAEGDVKIEQGTATVTAPHMQLDNAAGTLRLTGGVHGDQPPDRTLDTAELSYNLNTGAFDVPRPVRGADVDGSFAADRMRGNMKDRVYDLDGHAVVHSSGKRRHGPNQPPTTLSAPHVHVDETAKRYLAEGGVTVVQADRTISALRMDFDDTAHIVKLTGGVHATQLPDRSADTAEVIYHSDSGDVSAPSQMTGRTTTDSFRADRGAGNAKSEVYNLEGNVVLRRQTRTSSDPIVLTANNVRIDGKTKTYTATGSAETGKPRVVQGSRTMTAEVMTLDDTTHLVHLTGGVHAESADGRKFDTPELTYNVQTDDFKMLGGVTAFFPLSKPNATPTPFPKPSGSISPQVQSPFAPGATPAQFATPVPAPSPTPSVSATSATAPLPIPSPSPSPH